MYTCVWKSSSHCWREESVAVFYSFEFLLCIHDCADKMLITIKKNKLVSWMVSGDAYEWDKFLLTAQKTMYKMKISARNWKNKCLLCYIAFSL